jgi:hypothetical protein
MNLDIAATGPAPPGPTTSAAIGSGGDHGAGAVAATAENAAADAAVTVDMIPSSPPPEVMDAVGIAFHASERLAASGLEMRFALDPSTGKVTVEVHDLQGNLQSTVPPSTALSVADGGTVD